jgi:hypothetical protein
VAAMSLGNQKACKTRAPASHKHPEGSSSSLSCRQPVSSMRHTEASGAGSSRSRVTPLPCCLSHLIGSSLCPHKGGHHGLCLGISWSLTLVGTQRILFNPAGRSYFPSSEGKTLSSPLRNNLASLQIGAAPLTFCFGFWVAQNQV